MRPGPSWLALTKPVPKEWNAKAVALDKVLLDAGCSVFDLHAFGSILGTIARKLGSWDRVDAYIMEFISVAKALAPISTFKDTQ